MAEYIIPQGFERHFEVAERIKEYLGASSFDEAISLLKQQKEAVNGAL